MSGFGAPALTAMATLDPASVTSEPDRTFPCLSKASMPARLRIKTSARSPASMRATSIGAVPQVTASRLPLRFSNSRNNSSAALRTPMLL
jgi:hypothetical protein